MNTLQKIATICIRTTALGMLLTALVLWGLIAVGVLLSALGINSYASVGLEVYFIQGFLMLFIGIVLYARSRSLAAYIASGLQEDDEPSPRDE